MVSRSTVRQPVPPCIQYVADRVGVRALVVPGRPERKLDKRRDEGRVHFGGPAVVLGLPLPVIGSLLLQTGHELAVGSERLGTNQVGIDRDYPSSTSTSGLKPLAIRSRSCSSGDGSTLEGCTDRFE